MATEYVVLTVLNRDPSDPGTDWRELGRTSATTDTQGGGTT